MKADAVVSKVNKTYDEETHENQYTFYVTYTDENGTEREARLMTKSEDYQKGQTLRIKYLPGKYKTAKPI